MDRYADLAEQRIAEFHEENPTLVLGVYERAMLHQAGGRALLSGNGAVLFRRGQGRVSLEPGEIECS